MRRVATVLALLAILAGCGTKGPLYLPDETPKTDNNSRR
jgi:predicted small lipoprotein YifL